MCLENEVSRPLTHIGAVNLVSTMYRYLSYLYLTVDRHVRRAARRHHDALAGLNGNIRLENLAVRRTHTLLARVVRLEVSDLPLKGSASFDHCPVRLALRCSAAAPTRARPDLSPSDRALSFLPGVRWDPDLAGDFQALVRAPEGRAELEEVVHLAEECVPPRTPPTRSRRQSSSSRWRFTGRRCAR